MIWPDLGRWRRAMDLLVEDGRVGSAGRFGRCSGLGHHGQIASHRCAFAVSAKVLLTGRDGLLLHRSLARGSLGS
jgi:hypothetical protein